MPLRVSSPLTGLYRFGFPVLVMYGSKRLKRLLGRRIRITFANLPELRLVFLCNVAFVQCSVLSLDNLDLLSQAPIHRYSGGGGY